MSRSFAKTWPTAGVIVMLAASQSAAGDLSDALAQGTLLLDARTRYENVHQAGFVKDADAWTIRIRAGYRTADFHGFKLLAEMEDTEHLTQAFNDTVNGHANFPVVSDPENLELNRLQLSYTGIPDATLTVGRQVINLDDQRFIGASGFRQNQQTFDAARADFTPAPNLSLSYFYADRVNRVLGERSAQGQFDGDVQAFNAAYDIADVGKLVGYIYLLDLHQAPLQSTATLGLQLSAKRKIGQDLHIRYTAVFARQDDYGANPLSYAVSYWRGEAGLDYGSWSLLGGYESLGSDGRIGFSTPLATLHAYQGYADVFLNTPARGVNDAYLRLGFHTTISPFDTPWTVTAAAWRHAFDYAEGAGSLGSETDLETTLTFNEHWRVDAAYATYDGVPGFASRSKTWLAVTFSY